MANIANRLTTRIAYDGAALRYGSMDVRELAPALLAVGDLFQQANYLLNGDEATLAVKVKADITRGSFELNLELVQGFALACIFAGADAVKTVKEIAEYVGFVTGAEHISLFGLLKRLRGRKPRSTTTLEDGTIEITIEGDDNTVIVSPIVYRMASDPRIRKAARDVVRPLFAPGVDVFEIREGGHVVESVTRHDLHSFALANEGRHDVADVDTERIAVLEVIQPSFHKGLPWLFSDGSGGRLTALVQDRSFLTRVLKAERTFAKGDVLLARIRSHSLVTAEGLRTAHVLVEVLEEIDASRQVPLMPTSSVERTPPQEQTVGVRRRRPTGAAT